MSQRVRFSCKFARNVIHTTPTPAASSLEELAAIRFGDAPVSYSSSTAEYEHFLAVMKDEAQVARLECYPALACLFRPVSAPFVLMLRALNRLTRFYIAILAVRKALHLAKSAFVPITGSDLSQSRGPGCIGLPLLCVTGEQYGAPHTLHVADGYAYTMCYHHRGASKFWLVVLPSAADRVKCGAEPYQQLRWGSEWPSEPRCA